VEQVEMTKSTTLESLLYRANAFTGKMEFIQDHNDGKQLKEESNMSVFLAGNIESSLLIRVGKETIWELPTPPNSIYSLQPCLEGTGDLPR
jgi:hypothetical protein